MRKLEKKMKIMKVDFTESVKFGTENKIHDCRFHKSCESWKRK